MARRVLTSILLRHSAERVWDVLADFRRYAEWNPLTLEAAGEAVAGARVWMRFVNPARDGASIVQTVTVTRAEPGRLLGWRGQVPLLFTGDHLFELAPDAGGTRLYHSETLSGPVPRLLFSDAVIESRFVPAYEACNRALSDRLDALENVIPLRAARR